MVGRPLAPATQVVPFAVPWSFPRRVPSESADVARVSFPLSEAVESPVPSLSELSQKQLRIVVCWVLRQ